MSQEMELETFYPHPPERVWQALTDRRALSSWMMDNDFEACLGHQFQFQSCPLPGLKVTIYRKAGGKPLTSVMGMNAAAALAA